MKDIKFIELKKTYFYSVYRTNLNQSVSILIILWSFSILFSYLINNNIGVLTNSSSNLITIWKILRLFTFSNSDQSQLMIVQIILLIFMLLLMFLFVFLYASNSDKNSKSKKITISSYREGFDDKEYYILQKLFYVIY